MAPEKQRRPLLKRPFQFLFISRIVKQQELDHLNMVERSSSSVKTVKQRESRGGGKSDQASGEKYPEKRVIEDNMHPLLRKARNEKADNSDACQGEPDELGRET